MHTYMAYKPHTHRAYKPHTHTHGIQTTHTHMTYKPHTHTAYKPHTHVTEHPREEEQRPCTEFTSWLHHVLAVRFAQVNDALWLLVFLFLNWEQ